MKNDVWLVEYEIVLDEEGLETMKLTGRYVVITKEFAEEFFGNKRVEGQVFTLKEYFENFIANNSERFSRVRNFNEEANV